MDGASIAVAVFALIAIVLLIPPLVWHSKYGNIPVICLISWFIILNLKTFINLCIWSGEDFMDAWNGVGYCDVMVKLEAGSSSGTTAAIAALSLNMYMILRAKNPTFMDENSKKKAIVNLLICLATPGFVMATNYAIQSSRYDIVRFAGCNSSYVHDIKMTIPLFTMWSLIWSMVAIVFSCLALYKFFQKRREVSNILKCTNSSLDVKKFARLLIFNCMVVVALSALAVYYFVSALLIPNLPITSFQENDRRVIYYQNIGFSIIGDRIAMIGLSIVTFLIFGLGTDALKMYKKVLRVREKPRFLQELSRENSGGTTSTTSTGDIKDSKSLVTSHYETTFDNYSSTQVKKSDSFPDVFENCSPYPKHLMASHDIYNLDAESGSSSPISDGILQDEILESSFDYKFQVVRN